MLNLSDSIMLSDKVFKVLSRLLSDSISLSDIVAGGTVLNLFDSIRFYESYGVFEVKTTISLSCVVNVNDFCNVNYSVIVFASKVKTSR